MRGDGFDQLNTPLHTAVLLGSVEAVKLLLNAGASVACINSVGYTPLHLCLRNKIEELLEVMSASLEFTFLCRFHGLQLPIFVSSIGLGVTGPHSLTILTHITHPSHTSSHCLTLVRELWRQSNRPHTRRSPAECGRYLVFV